MPLAVAARGRGEGEEQRTRQEDVASHSPIGDEASERDRAEEHHVARAARINCAEGLGVAHAAARVFIHLPAAAAEEVARVVVPAHAAARDLLAAQPAKLGLAVVARHVIAWRGGGIRARPRSPRGEDSREWSVQRL